MKQYDAAVIGAGPPDCPVRSMLLYRDDRILLLEKNTGPGNKLLLAGSGQCNFTHTGDIRDFLSHYGDHGKFLKPALFSFPNQALIAFFATRGLGAETDANGKIFPETRKSADVLALLVKECGQRGVDLHCAEPVTGLPT